MEENNTVSLSLTREQLEFLSSVLWSARDCGPPSCGWASAELQELRNMVDDEIEALDK